MKKLLIIFFACSVLLCACDAVSDTHDDSSTAAFESEVLHTQAQTIPTEPETQPTEPETTLPEHTPLYNPQLPVEDVLQYFNEVVLDAEFVDSGNPSLVQKWDAPIHYIVLGLPTEQDLAVLDEFTQWLNTLEGFPGISATTDYDTANLQIQFCPQSDIPVIMGETYSGLDGAVTFWYDGENRIYDAKICIRSDMEQALRNSVILEELYNGLGPVQDTDLRTDSIIYSGFSQPQELTQVDELILTLLYHPEIQCGMTQEECEEVIKTLYY